MTTWPEHVEDTGDLDTSNFGVVARRKASLEGARETGQKSEQIHNLFRALLQREGEKWAGSCRGNGQRKGRLALFVCACEMTALTACGLVGKVCLERGENR